MVNPRPLELTVREFATSHGIPAFLRAYYELVGAGPRARITAANITLAGALGLPTPSALPATFSRRELWNTAPTVSRRLEDRKRLSKLFADPDIWPELSATQRLYLQWIFSCPDDLSHSLMVTRRTGALGWFSAITLDGPDDLDLTTFAVVGCTIAFAVSGASDGFIHASHFNGAPENAARQASLLRDFTAAHDCRHLYILGFLAQSLAESLAPLPRTLAVHLHRKADGHCTSYHAVRFRRTAGQLSIDDCSGPVPHSDDPAANPCLDGPCKNLWAYWDTSAVFPLHDSEFVPTPFTQLPISI